ncbi:MAG: HAMP domain-containing histidine kinase [Candidatus Riflebacteria bacterium]|nr:HAMP domain-containing histidine kinase [Candidatus Riflebacteria bacterium]
MYKTILQHPIYDFLYKEAALLFLVLDPEGNVIEANNYAKDIVGSDLLSAKPPFKKILLGFSTDLPPLAELIRGGSVPRMLSLATSRGKTQTYYFQFYEKEDRIYAFGQINHLEMETLTENLVEANNEINNLSRELHKTNAHLTKLNDQKNHFLGMAAHDLRNPLCVILQLSDFLYTQAESLLDAKQLKMLASIRNASKFMSQLINNFLDVSIIESGKLELELVSTDFVPFVERTVLVNQLLAEKKKIKLTFQGEKNLPQIMIDNYKIEQILNNLISNAIKYSFPESTVQISVQKSGDYILVTVQDEGQGIPAAELPKLFQAFQTTSVKGTAGEKSTGLGLLISKKIVSGHRGKIWVESKPGKGSTFSFTLPC